MGKPLPNPPSEKKKDGFVPLFNGKDLSGWQLKESTKWQVREGAMIGEGEKAVAILLRDNTKCSNFTLKCKFLPPDDSHSSINFWVGKRDPNLGFHPCYWMIVGKQAFGELRYATAKVNRGEGRVEVRPSDVQLRPGVEVEMEIVVAARRLTVKVDGQTIIDQHRLSASESSGSIGLRPANGSNMTVRAISLLIQD